MKGDRTTLITYNNIKCYKSYRCNNNKENINYTTKVKIADNLHMYIKTTILYEVIKKLNLSIIIMVTIYYCVCDTFRVQNTFIG